MTTPTHSNQSAPISVTDPQYALVPASDTHPASHGEGADPGNGGSGRTRNASTISSTIATPAYPNCHHRAMKCSSA